jgi:hypothetical protein
MIDDADAASEIKPREPVSNTVHRIDIKTGEYNEIKGTGDIPQARVGHTAATIDGEIYVFGGVSLHHPAELTI